MIRPLKILTVIFLISCNTPEKKSDFKQDVKSEFIDIVEPDHDTLPNGRRLLDNVDSSLSIYYKEVVGSDTLKGGYITCYGIDDSTKYFYLRHGDTLRLLNETSINTSTWSLGRLEKDFDNFFITTVDNGNGVPETYQVFDKKTGNNLLADNIEAWNFKYLDDTIFFLYDNHYYNIVGNYIDRKKADSIFLYNLNSGKRQGFKLAQENPNDIIYYDIKDVTKNTLIISIREHYTEEEKFVKYRR
jgi:hypothetical protein